MSDPNKDRFYASLELKQLEKIISGGFGISSPIFDREGSLYVSSTQSGDVAKIVEGEFQTVTNSGGVPNSICFDASGVVLFVCDLAHQAICKFKQVIFALFLSLSLSFFLIRVWISLFARVKKSTSKKKNPVKVADDISEFIKEYEGKMFKVRKSEMRWIVFFFASPLLYIYIYIYPLLPFFRGQTA